MLDRFGIGSHHDTRVIGGRYDDGGIDVDLVRRTAAWLRGDPDGALEVGLTSKEDIRALAALLDLLATELPCLDPAVRRATVRWCRVALGEDPPRNP